MSGPKTLLEAVRYFTDLDVCHGYMVKLKWPDGKITCPKCGGEKVSHLTTRRMFKCMAKECHKQFSAKVGTIFEDSPLGLDRWFVAVWCIANAKNGISSMELHRALGVTQKTAWFMLHRIRLAMKTQTFRKLEGVVESDETYVGGAAANMHAAKRARKILGRGTVGKAIVHGILERGEKKEQDSKVLCQMVFDTEQSTLVPLIDKAVDRSAVVITDKHASYAGLFMRYVHHAIDHAVEYVRGKVHVNGMENFWALLKRMLGGTYVAVAPFHLDRYLDEETWRFNHRSLNDGGRFDLAMAGVTGKRLTFRELCAIDDCGFMGIK